MIYDQDGIPISTHSMIKVMRRCPKQAQYKYQDRLKPRMTGRPLQMGKWMHWLLEAFYKGEDWRAVHRDLCRQYSALFDEEKEMLGNLPHDCLELMLSYIWHYKGENWKVHEVEFQVETHWPDGGIYRGKIDMLIENAYGLWIVDHKNHKNLPSSSYRLKDSQSALYVWAAREMGIPVLGFIWNYLKTASPSIPKLTLKGDRFYKKLGDTTYVTFVRELKRLGIPRDDPRAVEIVERLERDRYEPGKTQTSPFFARHVLERDDAMLARVVKEAYRTHRRLHTPGQFSDRDSVERVVDRSCDFMCSYTKLCETELYGGMTQNLINQNFRIGDPQSYYNDEKVLTE
jgi:hypothetical protein